MKKVLDRLFSTSAAGLYILLFAISIGVATFIENDFGTSSAQAVVFRSWWFQLLLALFGISILVNVFRFRMIQQRKWAILTFHVAMIVILLGAAATRFFGYEGMMHIREDSTSNEFVSSETYLKFQVEAGGNTYRFDEPVYFASLGKNKFKRQYQLGGQELNVEVTDYVPNPTTVLKDAPEGMPILKVVVAGGQGREEYFLHYNETLPLNGTVFNFGGAMQPGAINIDLRNDSLLFTSPETLTQMQMATQQRDTIYPNVVYPLLFRSLYSGASGNFVIGDYTPKGKVMMTSSSPKMKNESIAAVGVRVSNGNNESTLFLYGNKGMEGQPEDAHLGNMHITAAYGARRVQLPFAIRLRDFIMDRYPGTNSASSYASEVTLIDARNGVERDQRIFMNNILNYDGYRFFQSSYDQDELGTVLSVNHDFWGTWISYLGYALLTLGMLLTLVSRKSRFRSLAQNLKDLRKKQSKASPAYMIALLLMISTGALHANSSIGDHRTPVIEQEHATQFARLVVQDYKGRMKPMHTLAGEVLRKIARKERLYDQTPEQIVLGMLAFPDEWSRVPLIKIGKDEEIHKILGTDAELVPYDEFFNTNGQYILKDYVRKSYALEGRDRGMFDKELIKLDERVNICNMIFSGRMLRIFPIPGAKGDEWLSPSDVKGTEGVVTGNEFVQKFIPAYLPTVHESLASGDWALADEILQELAKYQHTYGSHLTPSQKKIDMEILLNKSNVFARLGKYYGLLGLGFLLLFFTSVFNHKIDMKWPVCIAFGLMAACFLMHTAGLGIRWYVSGRAPWSNGYESMIYIAWTTTLAGLLFSRKSMGGLTATAVLAATILMVASLSYLDPEITPLVPVLRSYWLTIHVSMEAGSYGFLMLGAIIGILNLLLMSCFTQGNKVRVMRTIKELSWVSEMTLIGGLFMISIGTYLGGVWANESWGRYWGWDAKETWALVTILVYAFILHMRFIPGLRGFFAFNVASLFGFASVMMTYFGVNYYLSGLHSYAAGDPVPVPTAVYVTAGSFLLLSLLARWRWGLFKS